MPDVTQRQFDKATRIYTSYVINHFFPEDMLPDDIIDVKIQRDEFKKEVSIIFRVTGTS